jgi:hypothetical protein
MQFLVNVKAIGVSEVLTAGMCEGLYAASIAAGSHALRNFCASLAALVACCALDAGIMCSSSSAGGCVPVCAGQLLCGGTTIHVLHVCWACKKTKWRERNYTGCCTAFVDSVMGCGGVLWGFVSTARKPDGLVCVQSLTSVTTSVP